MLVAISGTMFALLLLGASFLSYKRANVTVRKIEEVHKLVNSQMTSVLDRVDQLTELLELKGIKVPEKRSNIKPRRINQ